MATVSITNVETSNNSLTVHYRVDSTRNNFEQATVEGTVDGSRAKTRTHTVSQFESATGSFTWTFNFSQSTDVQVCVET